MQDTPFDQLGLSRLQENQDRMIQQKGSVLVKLSSTIPNYM